MAEEVQPQSEIELENERLAKAFEGYRNCVPENRKEKEGELNDLLFSAINKFPDVANAIEIQLDPRSVEWSGDFRSTFYDSDTRRELVEYAQLNGGTVDKLVVPLPYLFTTGTHGSGERNAMGASSITIEANGLFREDKKQMSPGIGIEFQPPFIAPRLVNFDVKEIKGIRFVKTDEFSPQLNKREETKLEKRMDPTDYYLRYRGFKRTWNPENAKLYGVTPDEFAAFASSAQVGDSRELLHVEPGNFWNTLKTGFVVAQMDGEKVMWELNNVNYRDSGDLVMPDDNLGKMWMEIRKGRNGHKYRGHVTTYKGEDIIKRLKTIEPARRF